MNGGPLNMQLKALIFDDEECIRHMLYSMLTAEGCEVFTFDDPTSFPVYRQEGCDCDMSLPCADILLCDIYMPRVSGIRFIETLKKSGCKIPCMALMSGNWTAADLEKAKTLGLHVFDKPFVMSDLRVWLQQGEKQILQKRILCDRLRGGMKKTITGPMPVNFLRP
jgi:CheY-like chemotaxis protein